MRDYNLVLFRGEVAVKRSVVVVTMTTIFEVGNGCGSLVSLVLSCGLFPLFFLSY